MAGLASLDQSCVGELAQRACDGVLRSADRLGDRASALLGDGLSVDVDGAHRQLFEHDPRRRLQRGPHGECPLGQHEHRLLDASAGHLSPAQTSSPATRRCSAAFGARRLWPTRMTGRPSPVRS